MRWEEEGFDFFWGWRGNLTWWWKVFGSMKKNVAMENSEVMKNF
jgi:hypothetical protein